VDCDQAFGMKAKNMAYKAARATAVGCLLPKQTNIVQFLSEKDLKE
jgi:hypothetical protein